MNSEISNFNDTNVEYNNNRLKVNEGNGKIIKERNFNGIINDDDIKENKGINSNKQNDSNQNRLSSSIEWINYFKNSKINLEEINKILLSNVESIDKENNRLKEALCELLKELKEKENSLNESLKLISKLNNNYSILFHQYQSLEKNYSILNEENISLKKNFDISNKNKYNIEKINKKNESLKDEINKIKIDNLVLKDNCISKNNECMKLSEDLNKYKIMMNDFKTRNLDYINMIKERENLIMQYCNQIKCFNDEIDDKNEQIKLLVKFSKNINDENKSNVKELTKQACKTIKLLYNYNNENSKKENINGENNYANDLDHIINHIFINESNQDNSYNLKNNNFKISFNIKDVLQDNILKNNNMNINKEFINNLIIKFNLLKIELYSSYLREFQFITYLNKLMNKIDANKIKDYNFVHRIIDIKIKYANAIKENNDIKNKMLSFQNKVKELNLFIEKLKREVKLGQNKLKEKIKIILNLYHPKINKKSDNNLKKELNMKMLYDDINRSNKYYKSLKIEKNLSLFLNKHITNNNLNTEENKLFEFSPLNKKMIQNNKSFNILSFHQKDPINKIYNNNDYSFNEKSYQQKKIENEKLKEEISYLKNEIKELLEDMNKQRILNYENNFQEKNNIINNYNKCDNCEYINNLILGINIPDNNTLFQIKNIILNSSPFNLKIKNIINNIFDTLNILLSKCFMKKNNIVEKKINDTTKIGNIFDEILEMKLSNFKEMNKKIFSSSELKNYYTLYDEKVKNINELINIYYNNLNEIKNIFNGIKQCDSSISSNINDDIALKYNKNDRKINDEFIKMKNEKIMMDNSIEIIKHYLIINEKIIENFLDRKLNMDILKKYTKEIFNTFRGSFCYNLDDISDNHIFNKKLIIKLFEINYLNF